MSMGRSVLPLFTFIAFLTVIAADGAGLNTDFESRTLQDWKKNSPEVELKTSSDNLEKTNGSYALLASGQARNIGTNIQCKIPVTEKTMIEFDFRCDSQTPLHYFAFSAIVQGKEKPFWIHAGGGNALTNPVRGKWHHLSIPAAALKTPNKVCIEPGDVIKSFSIHQIYSDGGPHSFMIDNFRVYEAEGDLKISDNEKFIESSKPVSKKNLSIERNSVDLFPLITVPAGNAPVIDGDLSDTCWKNAVEIATLPNYSGKKITESTTFLLSYDNDNLYIGVKAGQCYLDPVLNLLDKAKCKAAEHDGHVYSDDSIEIFLLPGTDFYYQFVINSDGVIFDGKDKSSLWNAAGLKKAAKKHNREWTAEIAIPFKDIGLNAPPAFSDSAWRANFCRNNPAKDETAAWSPTEKSFHSTSAFGFIKFDQNAPVLQCKSLTAESGSALMKIFCEGRLAPLDIAGAQSSVSVKPGEKNELELKLKPDADGIGQIRISASGKEVFRSPSLLVKMKSSELTAKLNSENADIKISLNGKEIAASKGTLDKILYIEDDLSVIAIEASGLTKRLDGAFSVGKLEFPISDFLYSDKLSDGWDKAGFNDASWKPYAGEVRGKLFLRHTIIAKHSTFAPQLDNNTYYVANKAAVKLTFRLSSPLAEPLADYRFHLDVPDGITIPFYSPELRIYNKYKNSMSVKNEAGRNLFTFSFTDLVPKLAYNFGYNVITMVMKPDFKSDAVNQTLIGRVWVSGRGVHEIPLDFKIKVMPELSGRQPEKIPVLTWPHERELCLATGEMKILPETWRNAGFTAISVGANYKVDNSSEIISGFSEISRKNNIKTIYMLFGYEDVHSWGDIFLKNPDARVVPMSGVKLDWRKPVCPLYLIESKEVESRIMKFAKSSDYILDDMECGLHSSCFCPRCRNYFARENNISAIPDEKEILSKYKDKWIRHQVLMNRKVFEFMVKTARKTNPGIKSAVYNGYADCPPEQYGMDWSLYKDVDLLTAGYSESTPIIKQTRQALGGRPICPGLILDTNLWELPYADQNIKARLWKQLVDGGFGGVHVWVWNELDGRGLHAVADFTKGVAASEKFLDEKNEIPSKDFITGVPEGYAYVYKKEGEYLYVAINKNISPKKITVKLDDNAAASDLSTGRKFSGKKNFEIEIAPNDVMLLHVLPEKSSAKIR